jgi:hypothetical protein
LRGRGEHALDHFVAALSCYHFVAVFRLWISHLPIEFCATPPEFLQALGSIITRWTIVEGYQEKLLAHLLGANRNYLSVVSDELSTATVTNCIRTIVSLKYDNDPAREQLLEFLDEVDHWRTERNNLVHGLWVSRVDLPNEVEIQKRQWKSGTVLHTYTVTLPDLHESDREINRLASGFKTLGEKMGFFK